MRRIHQLGASLIEFLVASTLGAVVIGVIGSVLINNQRIASERTKELSLLQSTNSVLQIMKLDMHRAGYNGSVDHAVKLSGADNIFHVSNNASSALIAYVYASEISGASTTYTHAVYERRTADLDILRYCEKKTSTVMTTTQVQDTATHFSGVCNTLFHTRRIVVDDFTPSITELTGNISSAVVTVKLATKLSHQPSIKKELSFDVKQRNW